MKPHTLTQEQLEVVRQEYLEAAATTDYDIDMYTTVKAGEFFEKWPEQPFPQPSDNAKSMIEYPHELLLQIWDTWLAEKEAYGEQIHGETADVFLSKETWEQHIIDFFEAVDWHAWLMKKSIESK